jgi:hypothetical protein
VKLPQLRRSWALPPGTNKTPEALVKKEAPEMWEMPV